MLISEVGCLIQELIVVEGRNDVAAVRRAVEAEVVATCGYSLPPRVIEQIRRCYERRGIIILTDPDTVGERIRRTLAKLFPQARHAFVARERAGNRGDIGIENASPDDIRAALNKVRYRQWQPVQLFSERDLAECGLTGRDNAGQRREKAGRLLGIGYANAKQFLFRLNHYGVSRAEFAAVMSELGDCDGGL